MKELERVREESQVVDDVRPEWEQLVSEWSEGASLTLIGQLRCARAAAQVSRHYGRSSVEQFALEVGCSKSKVYDYARVWGVFGHMFTENSTRLENPLTMRHYVEASHAPDPHMAAEIAEDEGLSARALKARIKEAEEPKKVEKVETIVCPRCGGDGVVPNV